MFSRTTKDPEYPTETGNRNDGQNLVEGWLKNKKVNGHCATTLFNELLERIFLPKHFQKRIFLFYYRRQNMCGTKLILMLSNLQIRTS